MSNESQLSFFEWLSNLIEPECFAVSKNFCNYYFVNSMIFVSWCVTKIYHQFHAKYMPLSVCFMFHLHIIMPTFYKGTTFSLVFKFRPNIGVGKSHSAQIVSGHNNSVQLDSTPLVLKHQVYELYDFYVSSYLCVSSISKIIKLYYEIL